MAASTVLHEAADALTEETKNIHRALTSLQEELEAVDWYRQRADATENAELRDILLHNMREEMEHAAMLLEWLRRRDADLDERLKTYLFTTEPISTIEENEKEPDKHQGGGPASAPKMTVGTMKGGE